MLQARQSARRGFTVRVRPCLLPVALACAGALISGCGGGGQGGESSPAGGWSGEPLQSKGMKLPARAQGTEIALATADGFSPRFWPGVNLGATIPGRSPGEVAVGADRYRAWFPAMAELGIRVIRVYTLLDPSFYEELAAYNEQHPEAPLYVIHGIWIPEKQLAEKRDLWDPKVLAEQRRLTREVYAAVSGDFSAPERLGEASGTWTADIRRWLVGWSPGIELEPGAIGPSERRNPPRSYSGRYISTAGRVSSTEAWLARELDHLATLDARAGWSRPITFTNWLTLDPLEHPTEPLPREDKLSVDAMNLEAEPAWPGGFFASYHVYPYYPDFLRYEYEDAEDPYAGYLTELRRHHEGQAVMVTEFGVPSSLGKAHLGPAGRDQGGHSEREAMAIDAEMLRLIADSGLAGGIVFEWIDEWFKLTWNTVELELPAERRQMWRNALNNEESFGVWAAEARLEGQASIDGSDQEWSSGEVPSQMIWEEDGRLRQLRAAYDEAYLYLVLRFAEEQDVAGTVVGLDTREGSNKGLPGLPAGTMPGAEVAVTLTEEGLEIERAAWTDDVAIRYGVGFDYLEVDPTELERGSGAWHPPKLILNRPYPIPTTDRESPTEIQELGRHPWGDQAEDSHTLAGLEGASVELRLPWALLGFADPSSRTLVDPRPDGTIGSISLESGRELKLGVYDPAGEQLAETAFNWEPWQSVEWSQRPKAGIEQLAQAFADTGSSR